MKKATTYAKHAKPKPLEEEVYESLMSAAVENNYKCDNDQSQGQ